MNSTEKVSYATGLHHDAEALMAEGKTDEALELIEKASGLMDEYETETKAVKGFDELKARLDMPVNTVPVSVEDQKAWAQNDTRADGSIGNASINADFEPAGWIKELPAAAQPVWVRQNMGANKKAEEQLYKKAFETWMRSSSDAAFEKSAPADYLKILNETTNADGGFTVPSYTEPDTVINSGAFGNQIAPNCRLFTVGTDSGTIPTVGGVSVSVIAESGAITGAEDTPTFTGVTFNITKYGVLSRVTDELLADSASNIPQIVSELFDTAFGQNIDVLITNVVLASTAADSTAASATALVAQDLLDIYAAVPAQHRGDNCRWVMPSAISSAIAGIQVTGSGARGIQDLAQDPYSQLMGKPVINNDNSSNLATTLATGNEVAILGDWNQFALIRREGRTVRRLNELYAGTGQVGFLATERNDQEVVLPTAFKILKMA
tara:strand:+ start:171 stop:1481 length:1311 start_codon:yes stop_codon:yes gene_type:complete